MVNILWLPAPDGTHRGFWDQGLLEDLFAHRLWVSPGLPAFGNYEQFDQLPEDEGGIVVLPGQYYSGHIEELNRDLAYLPWCLVIITSDEGQVFPWQSLSHPNMKIWLQTARTRDDDPFAIDFGYPPDTRKLLKDIGYQEKTLDWYFAGQFTHARRKEFAKYAENLPHGEMHLTKRFQEIEVSRHEYMTKLAKSKLAPAPAGIVSPGSFRFSEGLEAGAIPLADAKAGELKDYPAGYWQKHYGDIPLPIVDDWSELEKITNQTLSDPRLSHKVFAWWQQYKRRLSYKLRDEIAGLWNNDARFVSTSADSKITVLIPTSPVPANPAQDHIDEVIQSVRYRLPDAEIIVMFDGVRKEQKNKKHAYFEYVSRMLWKCNHEYQNVLPIVFDNHIHQAGMTAQALKLVTTPYILFCEHDTPLVGDIPFDEIITQLPGDINLVRLLHESKVLDVHAHLHGEQQGMFLRTRQWSQRPHIARTDFYREIINEYFKKDDGYKKTMIEDRMHGAAQDKDMRLAIYVPEEGSWQRSDHSNARQGDSKFEESFEL